MGCIEYLFCSSWLGFEPLILLMFDKQVIQSYTNRMELHDRTRPESLDQPLVSSEGTLSFSAHALRERLESRNLAVSAANMKAEELFASYPEGVYESDLVNEVKAQLGVRLSVASAAVDRLRSCGLSVTDWHTGFITHGNVSVDT